MRATDFILLILLVVTPLVGQPLPTIDEHTKGLASRDGFVPYYWDDAKGKIYLRFRPGEGLIYVHSLASGLGSNPVGLDRKKLGATRYVELRRVGRRLLMVQPNLDYRALSEDPSERAAVRESFAESVLFGFEIVATADDDVLVDGTTFVVRDAQGIARTLKGDGGTWKLAGDRSCVWVDGCRAFPDNTELEAMLTFSGDRAGRNVRSVAPTSTSVSLRQHHSFVRLPPPGYVPRESDPRAPSFGVAFMDYAAPLSASMDRRFVSRHRLEKVDPSAAMSEAKEPIVYYLDRGVPEPVRSALLEGAGWWNEAFEAAGFKDAFRVEVLPEGADPLDVRYNVINWVHRSTRGWSYGSSVTDPRTGEIIKGHVLLGSLRVRQDRVLFEGLDPRFASGHGGCCAGAAGPSGSEALALADPATTPVEVALARLRQLSAHEVGHTLGFAHNFAASVNDRASVMDYPAPKVALRSDGSLDLSQAYDVGIGEWDKYAVRFAYSVFPREDEEAGLRAIVGEWLKAGFHFASDQDARSLGSAHAHAHLWDNGADPIRELAHAYEVRRLAMDKVSERSIREGEPMAVLEETFVPLFLHHRYQLEAASKLIGGYDYTYALRGDGQTPQRPVAPARQRMALQQVLVGLRPETLMIPRRLLPLMPPAPFGGRGNKERLPRRTGAILDPAASAESAADLALAALLQRERASRLVQARALDPGALGLAELIDTLLNATWRAAPSQDAYSAAIERIIERRVLEHLMRLASASSASPDVRAICSDSLRGLRRFLSRPGRNFTPTESAHRTLAAEDIGRFLSRPWSTQGRPAEVETPPGSPIGR